MKEEFNSNLYNERNEHIKETLTDHESRLKDHEKRIVNQETDGREFRTNIGNLMKKMDTFITVTMWATGTFVTVGLFIVGILIKF